MNNPDRERKSEQHIKLCGSPNFTKPHGLLQSSPIGPNTNVNKGAIHLYGHSHGGIKDFGKSMDVGIDAHKEFRPFHINEILQIMEKREIGKNDSTWII